MSNSEPESEAEPKVKAEENSDSIVVVDPDDYQKTQKLKAIQDAKENYREFTLNRAEKFREISETWGNPKEAMKGEEATTLALYGSELIPLIEEGLEGGTLSEEDLKVETDELTSRILGKEEMDIREVVDLQGRVWVDGEKNSIPRQYQKRVYRQLERIERKLGLGLELETDKGPAEI
jgi:sugar phosphate isomerase/epimerase